MEEKDKTRNKNTQQVNTDQKQLEKRRKALKTILAGSGTAITAASLKDQWARPVVETVVLPAHAQASITTFATTVVVAANTNELLDLLVPAAHAQFGTTPSPTAAPTTSAPTTAPPTTSAPTTAPPATPAGDRKICIEVAGDEYATKIQVTIEGVPTLYSLPEPGVPNELPFPDTALTADPPNALAVSLSGALSADGKTVDGFITVGAVTTFYSAPLFGNGCNLTAPAIPG
jgi:hypothetical protein